MMEAATDLCQIELSTKFLTDDHRKKRAQGFLTIGQSVPWRYLLVAHKEEGDTNSNHLPAPGKKATRQEQSFMKKNKENQLGN